MEQIPLNTTAPFLTRHPANPLLKAADVPYRSSLCFNAGVCKLQGRYVMVFRNDFGATSGDEFLAREAQGLPRFDGTNLGLAFSDDGIAWKVEPKPCITLESAKHLIAPIMRSQDPGIHLQRFYDPRLTVIDHRVYMCFAIDTNQGLRGGVAVTDDFEHWEVLSASVPDNRNMVLFPEKVAGRYCRFERPVNSYGGTWLAGDQAQMWWSASPDLRHWGDAQHLLGSYELEWANDKMGPGAPPIKTPEGWLTTFHAVWRDERRGRHGWEEAWPKVYRAGLMLMDLEQPWKIKALRQEPLLSPEVWYETGEGVPPETGFEGFRNHVIFPGGMLLEDSGEVKIYYGAADTVECLATADVGDLLNWVQQRG